MADFAKKLVRAVFGYLLWDDRAGTPITGLPPRAPWWHRAWWGDEDLPAWWNVAASWVRRLWYRGKRGPCSCPGCTDSRPEWWSTGMCRCCAEANCCHDEPAEQKGAANV